MSVTAEKAAGTALRPFTVEIPGADLRRIGERTDDLDLTSRRAATGEAASSR
jgi:hypothetical protein